MYNVLEYNISVHISIARTTDDGINESFIIIIRL